MARKLSKPQMRSDYPKAAQAAPKKRKGFSINVLTYKDAYASIKAWYKNKRKGLTMTDNTKNTKTTKNSKGNSTTKTAIIAVAITLTVVAAFAATFYAGVRYHANYQQKVEQRASQIVTDLK